MKININHVSGNVVNHGPHITSVEILRRPQGTLVRCFSGETLVAEGVDCGQVEKSIVVAMKPVKTSKER